MSADGSRHFHQGRVGEKLATASTPLCIGLAWICRGIIESAGGERKNLYRKHIRGI